MVSTRWREAGLNISASLPTGSYSTISTAGSYSTTYSTGEARPLSEGSVQQEESTPNLVLRSRVDQQIVVKTSTGRSSPVNAELSDTAGDVYTPPGHQRLAQRTRSVDVQLQIFVETLTGKNIVLDVKLSDTIK